jgi:thiamine biosynthesis lipoprotein
MTRTDCARRLGGAPRPVARRGHRSGLLALALLLCLLGRARAADLSRDKHIVSRDAKAMGTVVHLGVFTDDEAGALAAIDEAFAEFRRLEALMTTWREDSEVSRINAQAGIAPVRVSDETFEVLEMASRASRLSGGAFDITFYALRGLWKFDEDLEPRLPDRAELARRLPLVNYRRVRLDRAARTVFLERRGMAINLGGIAKGYAVDRAAAILKRRGFPDAIVQAGGDLLCAGSKDGQPWGAGIRDPRGDRDDVFAVLRLTEHAFSTAGDYERYFSIGGRRYHHILDPKTGYPAMKSRSVTLYAPTALLADALDDAVFILGWKRGLALVERVEGAGAVIVDDRGEVHVSSRMKGRVEILHPPLPDAAAPPSSRSRP